jgi:uncharacterized protein YbbK (DUF523 family)
MGAGAGFEPTTFGLLIHCHVAVTCSRNRQIFRAGAEIRSDAFVLPQRKWKVFTPAMNKSLPSDDDIKQFALATPDMPLKVLFSACLLGDKVGVDGSSYGEYEGINALASLPNVKAVKFCPENFSFGTPRNMPDIYGGNGFDVLEGRARVMSDKGEDWTAGMMAAAQKMLEIAKQETVELAVMMDMSAACGSQVISLGNRLVADRKYQRGPGVAAALLMRNGIKVVSQRDFKTLSRIMSALKSGNSDGAFENLDPSLKDHHETDWYREYFR